jgi:hypothetical protein
MQHKVASRFSPSLAGPFRADSGGGNHPVNQGKPGVWGLDISALKAVSRRDNTIVAWHEVPGKASLGRTVP